MFLWRDIKAIVYLANSTGTAVGRACINNKTVGLVLCNTLKLNESVTSCDVCTDNECNASSIMTFKIISIMFPIGIALYLA